MCFCVLISVPGKTFGIAYGNSWFDLAEKTETLRSVPEFLKITEASKNSELFTVDWYTNCLGRPIFSGFMELQKYSNYSYFYRLFCFWQILFFRVLFAYFDASMASIGGYEPWKSWNTVDIKPI